MDGKIDTSRKTVTITLLDEIGNEFASWKFEKAWPIRYPPPSLDANRNEIAMETLEITHLAK
jgi:phage tail-like protein